MDHRLSGVDHVLIGVRDLERARAGFERLGFATTPRGRHAGRGTANHCLMFPDDYVELIGVIEPTQHTGGLDGFLAEREGLLGFALRSEDPAATRAAWQEAGLRPSEVQDFGRVMAFGEGEVELRFKDVLLDADTTAGLRVFACAALTPEAMRRPEWLAHPNGAIGIGSLTVAAADPEALAATLAKLVGHASLTETDDTLAVHTGRAVILVATPDDFELIHPELEEIDLGPIDDGPRLAALTLMVEDPDRTAAYLDERGVPYRRQHAGTIGVAPEQSHGVSLEFAPVTAFPHRSGAP
jgi:catechol 2,3-dioxygenase-like lactoylglutathione lyase family enzyme